MEHSYRQANDTYGDLGVTINAGAGGNFPQIGVDVQTVARYTYSIAGNATSFTATATANLDDDATNDVWTINDAGILLCTSDDSVN